MPKTFLLTSFGTLGDVLPFLQLGEALRDAGHRVIMAIPPYYLPLAHARGLETRACRPAYSPERVMQEAHAFHQLDTRKISLEESQRAVDRLELSAQCEDVLAACAEADFLLCSTLQYAGSLAHERLGIPWAMSTVTPWTFSPRRTQPKNASGQDDNAPRWPGEPYYLDQVNRLRQQLGMPPQTLKSWRSSFYAPRLLFGWSEAFMPFPSLVGHAVEGTGFWSRPSTENPPHALVRFLEAGPPPLALSLSSVPLTDQARVLQVHVEAAQLLGQRLIVQAGWAGLTLERLAETGLQAAPDRLCLAPYVAHDWLFPQVRAVMTHGGIGTTAEALRAGKPVLVEPYGNDQFFNALMVVEHGWGAAAHPQKLTGELLAELLVAKVLTPEVAARTQALGARLREEAGLSRAVEVLEKWAGEG